jgi:hypothetical protein
VRRLAAFALAFVLADVAPGGAEPLEVSVRRIESFSLAGGQEPIGPLTFLGGLRLTSPDRDFGGFSGIWVSDDGAGVVMIGDSSVVVRARLAYADGRLTGISGAEIDSLFPDGDTSKEKGDAEDIAFDPADPQRGVIVRERQPNAMLTFRLEDGRPAGFEPKRVGADDRILRSNKGLESVAYAPPASPAAGDIITIAERPPRGQTTIPGWIAGVGAFEIVPHDAFDVSSARFLPNGDLLLLERRFSPGFGIALRLRRIAGEKLGVGARLDGEYLLDAGMGSQIDNMEGLAVHVDEAGRTILTLVSDDNHSILQRTLILQFALSHD